MVEAREAVEFADAGLDVDADFVFAVAGGEGVGEGREGLQAPVKGRAVDPVDGRGDGQQVRGELLGLEQAVAGECWVRRDARWAADVGAVFAGLGIDDPIGAELEGVVSMSLVSERSELMCLFVGRAAMTQSEGHELSACRSAPAATVDDMQ